MRAAPARFHQRSSARPRASPGVIPSAPYAPRPATPQPRPHLFQRRVGITRMTHQLQVHPCQHSIEQTLSVAATSRVPVASTPIVPYVIASPEPPPPLKSPMLRLQRDHRQPPQPCRRSFRRPHVESGSKGIGLRDRDARAAASRGRRIPKKMRVLVRSNAKPEPRTPHRPHRRRFRRNLRGANPERKQTSHEGRQQRPKSFPRPGRASESATVAAPASHPPATHGTRLRASGSLRRCHRIIEISPGSHQRRRRKRARAIQLTNGSIDARRESKIIRVDNEGHNSGYRRRNAEQADFVVFCLPVPGSRLPAPGSRLPAPYRLLAIAYCLPYRSPDSTSSLYIFSCRYTLNRRRPASTSPRARPDTPPDHPAAPLTTPAVPDSVPHGPPEPCRSISSRV